MILKKADSNKAWFLVLITILIIYLVYSRARIWRYKELYLSTTRELHSKLTIADGRIKGLKSKEMYEILTENSLMPNVKLENLETGITVYLLDLIKRPTIVYRFTESSCLDCVIQDIEALKRMEPIVGIDNIIILTGYENLNQGRAFKQAYDVRFKCYNYYMTLEVPMEPSSSHTVPFFFVLKENLEIIFPYGRDNQEQNEKYLNRVAVFIIDQIK